MRTFIAIAYNEVLLNSKRVAPYIVAALCAGNAVLWWGWGPASGRGLAVNSDFFIAGVLPPYSFLFLPLYTALMMADPPIRDFREGITPLIFSKPITRAEYLLGKFFGNFFVLACCQAAFVLTLFVLQWVPKQRVTVQATKFLAYPKHFLVFVAISHMLLAAVYFTVGTLTRNARIVYGLGIAFYPIYIAYQLILLKRLPWRWKLVLDPLVMNRGPEIHTPNVALMNQLVVVYDTDLIVNRVVMILLTAVCLTILYRRFSTTERTARVEHFSFLSLSTAAEGVYYQEISPVTLLDEFKRPGYHAEAIVPRITLPDVARLNQGIRANLAKLIAAIGVEFRLLRAERSLVVIAPLAIFLCLLEVAFYNIHPDVSLSAAYASNTATSLSIFLIGMAVFYTGEAMHRDREIRIESFLWTTPVPNSVLILSKFLCTLFLVCGLILSVGIAAIFIQILRRHTPVDLIAYLKVYGLILLPSALVLTALSLAVIVLLRNKYAFYVVAIGAGTGLLYLYNLGYNHWLYNPTLYRLWTFADLTNAATLQTIAVRRLYVFGIAAICIAVAHLRFQRR
jgi:ABC-type transport system involved in multi-copper enzyme maturation permease subunit